MRLYWPGLTLDDDPRRHRFWTVTRLLSQGDLVGQLRGWLGSLSAVAVPEHPFFAASRAARRKAVLDTAELPAWVLDYIAETDAALDQYSQELREMVGALAEAQQAEKDARDNLATMRQAYDDGLKTEPTLDADPSGPDLDSMTVAEAFHLARQESEDCVVFLDSVDDSIEEFSTYKNPRRLYEALSNVAEAARSWRNGTLGAGFGAYFSQLSYEFSAKNPAAKARRSRAHYRRTYKGSPVLMEPHLKVDQNTSPDQCLRVYWYVDESEKILVVGHAGRHLPD